MARVKFSSVIDELKGSIGNITFQSGQSGDVARFKPYQSNFATVPRDSVRYYMKVIVATWQSLSVSDKGLWIAFAASNSYYQKNNPTIKLTGYQLFVMYNCILKQNGQGLQLVPITPVPLSLFNSCVLSFTSGQLYATCDISSTAANYLYLRISRAGQNKSSALINSVRVVLVPNTPFSSVFNITSQFYSVYNSPLAAGLWLYYEWRAFSPSTTNLSPLRSAYVKL